MNGQPKRRSRVRGAQIISIVSVALVLIILGIVALTGVTARNVTRSIQSNIGFVAVVNDLAADSVADSLATALRTAPYTASVKYSSAEVVFAKWKKQMGEEDLMDLNPFLAEYEVKVKPQWSSADSLASIASRLEKMGAVSKIELHTEMARNVNRTIHSIIMVLLIVAAAMLLISFVLINNTVRMSIYTQRMIIHTMQYVGATRGFIRRPYVCRGLISGIIAGVIAAAVVGGLLAWAIHINPALASTIDTASVVAVMLIILAIGAALCTLASLLATNRYLNQSYDKIASI